MRTLNQKVAEFRALTEQEVNLISGAGDTVQGGDTTDCVMRDFEIDLATGQIVRDVTYNSPMTE